MSRAEKTIERESEILNLTAVLQRAKTIFCPENNHKVLPFPPTMKPKRDPLNEEFDILSSYALFHRRKEAVVELTIPFEESFSI